MSEQRQADVVGRLNAVLDPCSVAAGRPMGLADMGLVERVEVGEGGVDVYLRLTSPACYLMTHIRDRIIAELDGIALGPVTVHVDEGLDWSPALIAPHLRQPAAR
jgi:metal-sulfur cluster biosynthetic enzyme